MVYKIYQDPMVPYVKKDCPGKNKTESEHFINLMLKWFIKYTGVLLYHGS